MTDPSPGAPGARADARRDEPRQETVTLVAPDGGVVEGILWTPPAGRWSTAVALTHAPGDRTVQDTCCLLAAAGLAVLAFAGHDDGRSGGWAPAATAVAHLRELGGESIVMLEFPELTPGTAASTDPVLVTNAARGAGSFAAGTQRRGGRGRVLAGATAVGLVVGIGLTVATGVLVWPVLGAVAGVGVGDLVAGGRR